MQTEPINVPPKIAQAWRNASRAQKRRAEEALAAILRVQEAEVEQESISAYDLVKHAVGCIEGPEDMSHNPKYLDDLGESSLH